MRGAPSAFRPVGVAEFPEDNGRGQHRASEFAQNTLNPVPAITRTGRALLGVALLFLMAGCASQARMSTGQGSSGSLSASWQGSDLLWDALGTKTGFTAVGNSGVVVTSSNGLDWSGRPRQPTRHCGE